MIEENVVAAAGSHNRMGEEAMRALIRDAGFTPVKRGSVYERCREACCRDLPALPDPEPRGGIIGRDEVSMTLSPGSRLGPYEILAPLGAGGWGGLPGERPAPRRGRSR